MSPILLSFSVQWRTMMWGCCFYQDPIRIPPSPTDAVCMRVLGQGQASMLTSTATDMSAAQLLGQTEAEQALPAPAHLSRVSWRSAEIASKQVSPPMVPNRKKMWHPLSNKSARTLCMHRYQKQVSGSLEEFNSYFKALSGEAKVLGYYWHMDQWDGGCNCKVLKQSYVLAAGWVVWQEGCGGWGMGARSREWERGAGSRNGGQEWEQEWAVGSSGI
ncbi:hypothetical protein F5141DRAFT_1068749 [Pisolithus sp. B1]|nr:hypothetical protein F5141DRAFT_1068749 [Pisolithus sp. B1]